MAAPTRGLASRSSEAFAAHLTGGPGAPTRGSLDSDTQKGFNLSRAADDKTVRAGP
jgi:hypothetical protein